MGLPAKKTNATRQDDELRRIEGFKEFSAPQKFIYGILEGIEKGYLTVTDQGRRSFKFGNEEDTLRAHLIVQDNRFFDRVIASGSLGLGESYVDGWCDIEEDKITDFVGILLRNHLYLKVKENIPNLISAYLHSLVWNPASLLKAKRCIHHHYDLSNDFFRLFLDPTMAYSCGYELCQDDGLEAMQINKYARICAKLDLSKGGHLLDIGCGWGGLVIYAVRHFPNIYATGITLSEQQAIYARQLVAELGLEDRIRIEVQDYRLLKGNFDFIASVGMFEHVGLTSYPLFMESARHLLKPSGVFLLHTIGLTDPPSVKPDPWTNRYIFPGSRLPRLEEMVSLAQKVGFTVGHLENMKMHYATTLRLWKENFDRNREHVMSLDRSFDDRFMRLWNYYLQLCEAGFRYSNVQLYQLLLGDAEEWPPVLRFDF